MRALLLAAGLGTRLAPITNKIPKCLVPINGRPLLEIWIEKLVDIGISEIVINTHYLADQVESFINTNKFRNRICLKYEPTLLGTAGTLLSCLPFFCGNDAIIIHADNFCQENLRGLIQAHMNRPDKCLMTMLAFRTDKPSQCGIIEVNDEGVVISFHEKAVSPPGNLANGAIYLLSADFIENLRKSEFKFQDFSTEVIPGYLGKIYAYETFETFLDIGTPENYMKVFK